MYEHDNWASEVEYNYDEYFPTKKLLWDVANSFHEQLKGRDEYINNDIVLNVDEENQMIHLTQWKSSKLKVRVECIGANHRLAFLSGRYYWGTTEPLTRKGADYARGEA